MLVAAAGFMESNGESTQPQPQKLLDRVRSAIRLRHYSPRTEEAYVGWIRRFVIFHHKRHPTEMGDAEVGQFLTHLAEKLEVSAATQNQALNSLVFLYREVLQLPLGKMQPFVRAKRPKNLPIVLTKAEVQSILRHMRGVPRLVRFVCCRPQTGVPERLKNIEQQLCLQAMGKGHSHRRLLWAGRLQTPERRGRECRPLHQWLW